MLLMYKIIFISLLIFHTSKSFKILVYNPRRSHSHVQFIGRIADILQEAGNSVTVLQPTQLPTVTAIGSKLAKVIIVDNSVDKNVIMNLSAKFEGSIWEKDSNNPLNMISDFSKMCKLLKMNCNELITNKSLIDKLKNEKFDIGFAELCSPCAFGIFELIGIKNIISGSSTGFNEAHYETFGMEYSSSYIPTVVGGTGIPKGIIGRSKNMFSYFISKYFFTNSLVNNDQEAFDEVFGVGKYDLKKIMSKSAFHFVNSNPLIDFPHPIISKIVDIAGIGIPEAKKIPQEYDKILNLRSENVLVSFGSIVKSKNMPYEIKMSILNTFKQYPNTTFIWKYEDDNIEFAKDYPNVVLKKWIPQVDLLNDGRIDLFITHGGLNSAIELSYQGVPSIFIPFFTDQERNSNMIRRYGCSIIIKKEVLKNSNEFKEYIGEILNNKKYLKNAKKLAEMIKLYPHEAKKKLIQSVEFAAKFGNIREMDLPSFEMNFIEIYNIDIYFLIFMIILFISMITILVLKKFTQMCCGKKTIKIKVD